MLCSVNMVNFLGINIQSEIIVDFLKKDVRIKDICQEIILREIIQQTAQNYGVAVTDIEIQDEANRQRYEMRLESAADTYAWLEDQLITADAWEAGIRDRLLAKKLAEHLFNDSIESHFNQNRLDYERAILYHIVIPYELLAQELLYQIEEDEISFYKAAHLYDINEQRRLYCGYENSVHRWSLPADISAQIFGARPREVIGPIQSDEGFNLYMVEDFLEAELTPEVETRIRNQLFSDWLQREMLYRIHNNDSLKNKD